MMESAQKWAPEGESQQSGSKCMFFLKVKYWKKEDDIIPIHSQRRSVVLHFF